MTNDMRQFVMVGESAGSNAAVKHVKVVVTAPPPSLGTLAVTLHVLQDTTAALTGNNYSWKINNFGILNIFQNLNFLG